MKTLALALLLAIAAAAAGTNAHAFSFTVDVPLQYTFKNEYLNKEKSEKPNKETVSGLEGFKVLIAGSFPVGIGYERYEVKSKGRAQDDSTFDIVNVFQFYDVFLDLPAKWAHFTLGYGMGRVNTTLPTLTVFDFEEADATQWFGSIGLPLGKNMDLHVAYHLVEAGEQKIAGAAGNDKADFSGRTLMAGARFAW